MTENTNGHDGHDNSHCLECKLREILNDYGQVDDAVFKAIGHIASEILSLIPTEERLAILNAIFDDAEIAAHNRDLSTTPAAGHA